MRPGRTKTTSFSLDEATLANLKALAARRHNGSVSALLAEVASREAKFAAAEAFFDEGDRGHARHRSAGLPARARRQNGSKQS